MRKRIAGKEVVETIINKMFEIAGHDVKYDDIKDRTDDWYAQWTMTEEQGFEWRDWMIEYFKKEFKAHPAQAKLEANLCLLMWGLKYRYNSL